MEANVKWTSGMAFEGHQDGFVIGLDADRDFGGQGQGPKPKTLLLTALGGCTAMDVVSILKKMQVNLAGFEVQASGELTEDHPKVLKSIHLKYVFKGSRPAPGQAPAGGGSQPGQVLRRERHAGQGLSHHPRDRADRLTAGPACSAASGAREAAESPSLKRGWGGRSVRPPRWTSP